MEHYDGEIGFALDVDFMRNFEHLGMFIFCVCVWACAFKYTNVFMCVSAFIICRCSLFHLLFFFICCKTVCLQGYCRDFELIVTQCSDMFL